MERYQRLKSKEHTIYEITEAIRLFKKINEDALIRYVKISRSWYNKLKREIAKVNPDVFRFDRHTKEWYHIPLDSRNEDLPINPLVARNSLDLLIQIIKKHGRIKEEKLIQEAGITKGTYYTLKRKIVTSHPTHQYIFHFDKQTKNWCYLPLLAPTDGSHSEDELQKRIKEQPPNPYAIKDPLILLKMVIKHYGQIKEEHLYLKAGISHSRYYELKKKLAEFEPNTIKFDRFTKIWHYLPTNPIPKEHDLPANIATARRSLDLLAYYIRQHGTIDEPSLIKLAGISTGGYFKLKKDLLEIDPQSIKFNRHTKTWHCSSPNPIQKEDNPPTEPTTTRNSLNLLVSYIKQYKVIDEISLIGMAKLNIDEYFRLREDLLKFDPESITLDKITNTWYYTPKIQHFTEAIEPCERT